MPVGDELLLREELPPDVREFVVKLVAGPALEDAVARGAEQHRFSMTNTIDDIFAALETQGVAKHVRQKTFLTPAADEQDTVTLWTGTPNKKFLFRRRYHFDTDATREIDIVSLIEEDTKKGKRKVIDNERLTDIELRNPLDMQWSDGIDTNVTLTYHNTNLFLPCELSIVVEGWEMKVNIWDRIKAQFITPLADFISSITADSEQEV